MEEEAAAINSADSFISNSRRLIEVTKSPGPCLGLLLSTVGIGIGSSKTFKERPLLIIPLVFIVDILYLALMFVTMFELQIKDFIDLLFRMLAVLIGIAASSLVLIIISPTIALIHVAFWILTFASMSYKIRKELHRLTIQKCLQSNVEGTMEEEAAARNSADSFISNSRRLIEVIKSPVPCLGLLLSIVGIGIGSSETFNERPLLIIPLVSIVDILYLALVFVTMFELQIKDFIDLLFRMVAVLIGTAASFLVLIIISPTIALIHVGFWFLTFASMCYKIRKELYRFTIQKWIQSNGMSIHNSDIPTIELLLE